MQFPLFQAPDSWRKITTLDMHTEGEPLRVIMSGFPELEGKNILDYRAFVRDNWDVLRTALMWEPRGHSDMYGAVITPAVSPEADFGTFFLHNEGYSTMCGHAIIALATLAAETGLIKKEEGDNPVTIDTPAGLVKAFVRVKFGEIQSAYFQNVPSFVVALDQEVEVEGMGKIRYDLAFGGAFYAYVKAEEAGVGLGGKDFRDLIDKGMRIKRAVMESSELVKHPFEDDLSFLYGTIFIGEPDEESMADSRNVCVFAEGEVDRSPTGTGVSGRMAIHHARGEVEVGEQMLIESILGTQFWGSVIEETTFGDFKAIIPQVEGRAFITGKHEFLIDPRDPLGDGFILR